MNGLVTPRATWSLLAAVTTVVFVILGVLRTTTAELEPSALPSVAPATSAPAQAAPEPPAPEPPAAAPPAAVPAEPGVFVSPNSVGPILGSAGMLKTFRITVESTVASEIGEFTRATDLTLGDERSWIADKKQRFQRVPDTAVPDFTISLVTRETAYKLCATEGLDIRVDGVPYTSCRITSQVVINLDRWRTAVPEYGADLQTYRQYVINHEVGHFLGHAHEPCPGGHQRAPVMQQQTLGLQGCVANPWPYPRAVM